MGKIYEKIKALAKSSAKSGATRIKTGARNLGFKANMLIEKKIADERSIRRDIRLVKQKEIRKQRLLQAKRNIRDKYKAKKSDSGFKVDFFGTSDNKNGKKKEFKYF